MTTVDEEGQASREKHRREQERHEAHLRDRPDVCPKGHRIWWFITGKTWRDAISWGVCSGKKVGDRILVAGACRHVWICRHAILGTIDQMNPESLLKIVREQAWQLGTFLDGIEEPPFISAEGGSEDRTLSVEESPREHS